MYKGGLIFSMIIQALVAIMFFVLAAYSKDLFDININPDRVTGSRELIEYNNLIKETTKIVNVRIIIFCISGALSFICALISYLALNNLSEFRKGKSEFSNGIATTAGFISFLTTGLIGGILILSGIEQARGNPNYNHQSNNNEINDNSNDNQKWLDSTNDNEDIDDNKNINNNIEDKQRVNEYDDILNKNDIKNETLQQLQESLKDIDYNHYVDLYIKSNQGWKKSHNNKINKLSDAIVYKYLIKVLTEEGFDTSEKGDINKFAENLILEEEIDYDELVDIVIKRIEKELSNRS